MKKAELSKADKMFLEKVAAGPVSFTYEPGANGHVKLVRSTTSGAQQPKYHALAVAGYLAEAVNGEIHHEAPPTTTVSFTMTAMGREALGLHSEPKPFVHHHRLPTEEELAVDAIE